jgi:hypothetical protein
MLMGSIALIIFLVVLSRGQFDLTSLLAAVGLLGLAILLRQRARRHQIRYSTRGRLLRRMLRRQPEDDLLEE